MSLEMRLVCAAAGLVLSASASAAPPLVGLLSAERQYQDNACACLLYAMAPAPPFSRVLIATTPNEARVVVGGTERTLKHSQRRASGQQWVNSFKREGVHAVLSAREVPFGERCVQHPDPPPHGSCFVGRLRVETAGRVETLHGVQVCAC